MKISTVTIVLNDKKHIEKTIQSVLSQSANFEYIVIDGGSTDGTMSIIEQYKSKIDIVINQKDNGIYNAMNKAIDLASGEWICFMNSGDLFYSNNTLNRVLPHLSNENDVVYGDHEIRYLKNKKTKKANSTTKGIWKGMIFSHQSCLLKRDILKQYKFNETYPIVADYDLFYRLYKDNKRFKHIPLLIASISAGGVSDIKRVESIIDRWNIVDKNMRVNLFYIKLIIIEIIKQYIKRLPGVQK